MEEHLEGCYKDWQVPHKISSLKKNVIAIGKKKIISEGRDFLWHILLHWGFEVLGSQRGMALGSLCCPVCCSIFLAPFIAKDAVNPTEAEQKVEALSPHALLSDCRQTASTLAHDMLASPALEDIWVYFLVNTRTSFVFRSSNKVEDKHCICKFHKLLQFHK